MQTRIKQLRQEMNMTQVRLSIELEVSQETISAYEQGKYLPSIHTLIKLSHIFNTSIDYILGLSEVKHPNSQTFISEEYYNLINNYKKLNANQKKLLDLFLKGLLSET